MVLQVHLARQAFQSVSVIEFLFAASQEFGVPVNGIVVIQQEVK